MNSDQSLLKAVFDTAPTAVLILQSIRDTNGIIIDFEILLANEAADRMAGRKAAGLRMVANWPHSLELGLFDQFVDTVNSGQPLITDKQYTGEGVDAWLYWRAARLNDGLCVTIEDITERRQAQVQIQQTAQNLQRVLDASPATIGLLTAIYDPVNPELVSDFRLIIGNQKLAEFFEDPLTNLIGQASERFGAMLWGEKTLEKLRLIYHTQQPYYEEKLVDESWMALSILRDDHGLVITGLDITQLKRIQAQEQHWLTNLERAQQSADALTKLRESLNHRSKLMRAVSHDLRANLSIMRGGLHLLDTAVSVEERSKMMEMVVRNVGQATDLLTNLLTFTTLEAGQQQRSIQIVEVSQLMQELAQSFRVVAQQKNLRLDVNGVAPCMVESDPLLLYRLIQNLLVNALKYTYTGGVTVDWGKEPDQLQWWIRVSDTGPGLASELVDNLNHEELVLEELHQNRRDGYYGQQTGVFAEYIPLQGEGIGLRIVRQLMTLLEGQLEVSSKLGVGTWFMLRFPIRYESMNNES